jgi:hypothetical protein
VVSCREGVGPAQLSRDRRPGKARPRTPLQDSRTRAPRHKKLADIISIESPAAFRESIRKLKRMGIGATEKRALVARMRLPAVTRKAAA